MIDDRGGNTIKIYHHWLFQDDPVEYTELDAVIVIWNAEHVMEVLETHKATGFKSRLFGRTEV